MTEDAADAPLSRRVPGAARPGPGQPAKPVLSESVLHRMKAAIDAEHAHADLRHADDPNTEPLPRVTVSGSPSKRAAKRPPSPSGMGPDPEPAADLAAEPERAAKPGRSAGRPRAEEPRAATPLRAVQPDWVDAEESKRAEEASHAQEPLRVAKALRAVESESAIAAAAPAPAEPSALAQPPAPAPLPVAAQAPALAQLPVAPKPPAPAQPPVAAEPPPPAQPPPPVPPPPAGEPDSPWWPKAASAGPTPGSIGWLWPEETGTRGGGGRWKPPGRRRYRTAALAAAGVIVLGGAGVFIGMALHSTPVAALGPARSSASATVQPSPSPDPAPTISPTLNPNAAALTAAAGWITQQVAPGTDIACDASTCAALTAAGFPADQEVQVGINTQSLSDASLVVMTPELNTFFSAVNPGLGSEVAPVVLASFGQVSIEVIDPAGAGAYENELSQDVQARIQVGEQLLDSGQVTASPTAESELAAGDVDSRVLLALQALANQEPIDILDFGDSGPGASPGVPFRTVDLAEMDPGVSAQGYLPTIASVLKAHATFPLYQHVGPVTLADGQTAIEIQYSAPSPLGLLSP